MADWRQIQARIRKAKTSSEPAGQLAELYERTRDAMVAFELAQWHEKAGNASDTVQWYTTAAQRFRRAQWRTKAEEALTRLGAPIPEPEPASVAAAAGASAHGMESPGGDSAANISSLHGADDTSMEHAGDGLHAANGVEPMAVDAEESTGDEGAASTASAAAAGKRRRRGRRGGRKRRGRGTAAGTGAAAVGASVAGEGAPEARRPSVGTTPMAARPFSQGRPGSGSGASERPIGSSFSAGAEGGFEERRKSPSPPWQGRSSESHGRPVDTHEESAPDLFGARGLISSGSAGRSRAGDPGLSSRIAQLESQLRRLLACAMSTLDEADQAPAGPGVLLLSDSDQVTHYYVEACQTLRIGVGNLLRGGRGSKGGAQLKQSLAEHLGINESRVAKYMKDHCGVRWIQLDEGAAELANFATAVLRPVVTE